MKETKIALITGANKGIGLEVARQLAEKGIHVFLTARNRELGNRAAAELAKNGAGTTLFNDPAGEKTVWLRRVSKPQFG